MRFSGEGNVLKYGVTVAKEFNSQGKFKLEILGFWSQNGFLTGTKLSLHQKPVYNMLKATITASGMSTLVFVSSSDKLNVKCQFLYILKVEALP